VLVSVVQGDTVNCNTGYNNKINNTISVMWRMFHCL